MVTWKTYLIEPKSAMSFYLISNEYVGCEKVIHDNAEKFSLESALLGVSRVFRLGVNQLQGWFKWNRLFR